MKKLLCILAVFMFALFAYGCDNVQGVTDGINNVNNSIQNVNKTVQDVNKSIQDTGNQLSPIKEDKGSGNSGSINNEEDSQEESDED